MGTILGSTLRGINRPENDKLNILMLNTCEKFQSCLAKTGHNFYLVKSNGYKPWNTNIRNIPTNYVEVTVEELNFIDIDIVLCQDRVKHYGFLANLAIRLSCPIIVVDYDLPIPEYNQFQIQTMADIPSNCNIVSSKFVAERWGLDVNDTEVIPKSIDTELFNGWVGGDNKILSVVDFYGNRKNITGFDLWEKINKQFKTNPVGNSPGFSNQTKNQNDLIDVYNKAAVFLNTSNWLSTPYEILEAMSCGCPVVTTKTTDIVNLIVNGENGFITNNYNEMVEYINSLLKDNKLSQKIGNAGRETILSKYNIDDFVEKWNKVFYSVIDNVCVLFGD